MRIGFAIALTTVTACYADGVLAPPRVESTIEIREVTTVYPPYTIDIDGVVLTYPRDSLRINAINASEIESVTVYKGLAASQLYPTHPCAAIIITTKHTAHPQR